MRWTVSDMWRRNHPWAAVYAFGIARPRVAAPAARIAFGTDIDLLYATADAMRDLPAGSRVLDVPCGTGIGLRGLRPGQGVEFVAADIAPAMLDRTRAHASARGVADQVTTRQEDVTALSLADSTFDHVVSLTGLHCVPDPGAAVSELARVLAPGGQLRLSWLRRDAGPRYRPILCIGRVGGLVGPSATVDDVTRWLATAGCADVDVTESGALAYATATKR